jgi:zinc-ribbon domain
MPRCPSCNADNPDDASACTACGTALKPRRPRRRREEREESVSPQAEAFNREVLALYRWGFLALIPVAGLILGPLVAYRARRFRSRVAGDPALAGAIPVGLAFWMGVMSGVVSWLGLTLMLLGLWLGW